MAIGSAKEIKLMYCYAREDETFRVKLERYLVHLKRRYHLTTWADRQIIPGEPWENAIDYYRAWKGFDWETLDQLYEKGWIENPRSKAKSLVLTETGLAQSSDLFEHYFGLSSETRDEPSDQPV